MKTLTKILMFACGFFYSFSFAGNAMDPNDRDCLLTARRVSAPLLHAVPAACSGAADRANKPPAALARLIPYCAPSLDRAADEALEVEAIDFMSARTLHFATINRQKGNAQPPHVRESGQLEVEETENFWKMWRNSLFKQKLEKEIIKSIVHVIPDGFMSPFVLLILSYTLKIHTEAENLHDLGWVYLQGLLGQSLEYPSNPPCIPQPVGSDIVARKCFEESKTNNARYRIGWMYEEGHVIDMVGEGYVADRYPLAMKHYEESDTPEGWKALERLATRIIGNPPGKTPWSRDALVGQATVKLAKVKKKDKK